MEPKLLRNGVVMALACLVPLTASCGKRKSAQPRRPAVVAPELLVNHAPELPGMIFSATSESGIRWQPWSRETFRRAEQADRLVLAVVCLPQQSGFHEVLRQLERHPGLAASVNSHYVPVLVDGDAVREMGLLAAPLCAEIKQPLDLPLFIWMTHEANPVAWMPISLSQGEEASRVFSQSHEMVSRMWQDDPAYVLRNSALDNASRRTRLKAEKDAIKLSPDPAGDSLTAARQLVSLYDPYSRMIDESGGLFPAGVLDVVTAASVLPGVPGRLRERSVEMLNDLLDDLLPSAMFDPLEGGVFAGRSSQSWALPVFSWNCPDQGRIATLLFRAHQITGDARALERALGLIRFAEANCLEEDGLFVYGTIQSGQPLRWLWTTEEIEKELPEEDARWWIAATGMRAIGNLPSEVDPKRTYFRRNSLSLPVPLEVTAARLSVPAEDFIARFEVSRKKLAELRKKKLGGGKQDAHPHLAANLRMVSAYAAAYASTGDEGWRGKAKDLLARTRSRFSTEGRLRVFAGEGFPESTDARAFLYALAIQSAVDVNEISPDDQARGWIAELAAKAESLFLTGEGLLEVVSESRIVDLPVVDRRRVFDDTTGGLFSISEARLAPSGHPAAEVLRRFSLPLPEAATQVPILYTDLILASLIRRHAAVVVSGDPLPGDLGAAVQRLPLQLVPRGKAKVSDGIPAGSVRVISPDGSGKLISDPSDLKPAVLPSGGNP